MLQIQCSNCSKKTSLPDSFAGKSMKCGCGTVLAVPLISAFPDQQAADAEPPALSAPDRIQGMRLRALKEGVCPVCSAPWPKIGGRCAQCNWDVKEQR